MLRLTGSHAYSCGYCTVILHCGYGQSYLCTCLVAFKPPSKDTGIHDKSGLAMSCLFTKDCSLHGGIGVCNAVGASTRRASMVVLLHINPNPLKPKGQNRP